MLDDMSKDEKSQAEVESSVLDELRAGYSIDARISSDESLNNENKEAGFQNGPSSSASWMALKRTS